jgi:hypothetical protein
LGIWRKLENQSQGERLIFNPSQLSRTTPLQLVIYYLHGCPAFQGFVTVKEIRIGCQRPSSCNYERIMKGIVDLAAAL